MASKFFFKTFVTIPVTQLLTCDHTIPISHMLPLYVFSLYLLSFLLPMCNIRAPWFFRIYQNARCFCFCFQARSKNFEKRLLAISCLSVCPSVRLHGTTRLPLDRFSRNFIFADFSKFCRENSSFIKIGQ